MPPRKPKKLVPAKKQADAAAALRKALAGQSKADLLDLLLEMAREDRGMFRQLAERFDVAAGPHELVAVTRQAIVDATDFDDRETNRNFDYDYEAYSEVKRNLSRLIAAQQLPLAMQLSLELMKAGSYQVEMSDEGEMTDDIEDCLEVSSRQLPSPNYRQRKRSPGARPCSPATASNSSPPSNFKPCEIASASRLGSQRRRAARDAA